MKKKAQRLLCVVIVLLFWGLGAQGGGFFDLLLVLSLGSLGIFCLFLLDRSFFLRLMRMRWGLLPLGCYLALDVIGFCVSGDWGLFWEKYRVTVMLLAVFGAILLLDDGRIVLWGAGLAALGLSLWTLLHYFVREDAPLCYLLRLSLRRDYNMYATALLIGWISLVFLLCRRGIGGEFFSLGATFLILPVLLQSGSRRVLLALPVVLAVMGLWYLGLGWERGKGPWRFGAVLCCGFLVMVAAQAIEAGLLSLREHPAAEQRLESGTPSTQTAAIERYETIGQDSLWKKRSVLWGLAIDEIRSFSAAEQLFGRGGGENIRLYDRVGEPLDAVYPDRAARYRALSAHHLVLADWIDGGLWKVGVLLWLLGYLPWGLWHVWRKNRGGALCLLLILGFAVASNLVSNRFGLLYDRVFLLFDALLLLETARRDLDEPSHCDADDPASA